MVDVLVTGGGSGGHVTPAIAVGQALKVGGLDVAFVGSNTGLEEALVQPAGLRFLGISAGKLRRYFSWQNVADAFRVLLAILQAVVLVGRERPTAVFSKGGFVAFPVVFAAWLWRVPVVAHESDATQGLANLLSAPFVKTLCAGFPETKVRSLLGPFKGRFVYTGAPIRAELLQGDAAKGRAELGVADGVRVLLVTGGSLGADALNAVVIEAAPELARDGWFVVHVCGAGKQRAIDSPNYRAFDYVAHGWADMLAAADLVLSRAGANTVFELLALGKPNLLVPLPAAGSRGDQLENAKYAKDAGYSQVLPQEMLDATRLAADVEALWSNVDKVRARLQTFVAADAVAAIVAEIYAVAPQLRDVKP